MKDKANIKEIAFMDLLSKMLQTFAECTEVDALCFICRLLDEMKEKNLNIK